MEIQNEQSSLGILSDRVDLDVRSLGQSVSVICEHAQEERHCKDCKVTAVYGVPMTPVHKIMDTLSTWRMS